MRNISCAYNAWYLNSALGQADSGTAAEQKRSLPNAGSHSEKADNPDPDRHFAAARVFTFPSFPQYLDPFKHLLFFAAWPMLAACIALYLLRELDTIATTNWGNR